MRVTAIRIRKLVSRPTGFGHDAAEIEAEVEPSEDAAEVAKRLHLMVDAEIRQGGEISTIHRTLDEMRNDATYWGARRDALKDDVERYRVALRQHKDFVAKAQEAGIAPPESLQDDIPF